MKNNLFLLFLLGLTRFLLHLPSIKALLLLLLWSRQRLLLLLLLLL